MMNVSIAMVMVPRIMIIKTTASSVNILHFGGGYGSRVHSAGC